MAKFENINKGFAKVQAIILEPVITEGETAADELEEVSPFKSCIAIKLVTDTGFWYVIKEANIISFSRDQATSFGKDDLINNLGEVIEKLDWY